MSRGRSTNEYKTPTETFAVEVRVGLKDSQVFIGTSQALQDVYETVTVRPGDQLHLLVGGDFLVRDGIAYEFDTRRHDAWEVMLHYATGDPALPAEKMRTLDPSEVRKPETYRPFDTKVGGPLVVVAP